MTGYFSTSTENNINNTFTTQIDTTKLPVGKYITKITSQFTCGNISKTYEEPFVISYPYYLVWTIDWEGYDIKNQYLDEMAEISENHHDIPMAHFFSPRIYITKTIVKNDCST